MAVRDPAVDTVRCLTGLCGCRDQGGLCKFGNRELQELGDLEP